MLHNVASTSLDVETTLCDIGMLIGLAFLLKTNQDWSAQKCWSLYICGVAPEQNDINVLGTEGAILEVENKTYFTHTDCQFLIWEVKHLTLLQSKSFIFLHVNKIRDYTHNTQYKSNV